MTLQSHHDRLDAPGLRGEIARLAPWFHNLRLPGGLTTAPDHPLGDFPAFKWAQIGAALPADLSGCRALDIGCNAGFYTFELARRGAHVLGVDHDPHYLRQAEWAARQLDLETSVELRQLDVYDLDELDESFDLVLFLGVLYHLRYPLLALDLVAEHVEGLLVLQTLTTTREEEPPEEPAATPSDLLLSQRRQLRAPGWPMMAFIEHELAGDPTNWWVPNDAGVEAMIRTTGLRVVGRPGHEMWLCERQRPSDHRAELARARRRRA